MSLPLAIIVGLLMGTVFGFALEKSRVFEPGIIVGQMQLRNFIMLKVFLTAVATGAVVLAGLEAVDLTEGLERNFLLLLRHADARVLHLDLETIGSDSRCHLNLPALCREFYGIRNQVEKDLPDHPLVG